MDKVMIVRECECGLIGKMSAPRELVMDYPAVDVSALDSGDVEFFFETGLCPDCIENVSVEDYGIVFDAGDPPF